MVFIIVGSMDKFRCGMIGGIVGGVTVLAAVRSWSIL